jgi:hypothetical protein
MARVLGEAVGLPGVGRRRPQRGVLAAVLGAWLLARLAAGQKRGRRVLLLAYVIYSRRSCPRFAPATALCHPGGPGPERTGRRGCGRAQWRTRVSANVTWLGQRAFVRRCSWSLHYHPGPRRAGRRQRRVAGRGRATGCGPSAGVPALRAAGPPVHATVAVRCRPAYAVNLSVGRAGALTVLVVYRHRLRLKLAGACCRRLLGRRSTGHGDDVLVAGDNGQRAQPDDTTGGAGYISALEFRIATMARVTGKTPGQPPPPKAAESPINIRIASSVSSNSDSLADSSPPSLMGIGLTHHVSLAFNGRFRAVCSSL